MAKGISQPSCARMGCCKVSYIVVGEVTAGLRRPLPGWAARQAWTRATAATAAIQTTATTRSYTQPRAATTAACRGTYFRARAAQATVSTRASRSACTVVTLPAYG